MTKESRAHQEVEWAKQKLDEIDATLVALEQTVGDVNASARQHADQALAQLKAARDAAHKRYDKLRANVDAARKGADNAYEDFKAEWADVELAFESFVATTRVQMDVARKAVAARAEAQRQSWERAVAAIQAAASDAVNEGQREFHTAIERLSAARRKMEAKAGDAASARDETWSAIKEGIDEARAAHGRAWKRIRDAFERLAK